jgi:hypothetical protein
LVDQGLEESSVSARSEVELGVSEVRKLLILIEGGTQGRDVEDERSEVFSEKESEINGRTHRERLGEKKGAH